MSGSTTEWRPTAAHLRACAAGVGLTVLALLGGRPDALVLATPLLIAAAWAAVRRPRQAPSVTTSLANRILREGEATTWTAEFSDACDIDRVALGIASGDLWELDPASGTRAVGGRRKDTPELAVAIAIRSLRWGRREVGAGVALAESEWGAFRIGPFPFAAHHLTTIPVPAPFAAAAPVPNPNGLVGANQSRRLGDGAEFAAIRPFATGDRLRRLHWPVSLRTGALHVSSSHVDLDTHVLLIVDATSEIGVSEGIEARSSSLDLSVRAAGAVAEHFLRRGDRVELRTAGARVPINIPTAAGIAHLRRILGQLATLESGNIRGRSWSSQRTDVSPGGLVLVFSPLLNPAAVEQVHSYRRRSMTVVAVDTMPAVTDIAGPQSAESLLAWRIRLLERARTIRWLERDGVAVAPWRGVGSLDVILRRLSRHAGAPKLASGAVSGEGTRR